MECGKECCNCGRMKHRDEKEYKDLIHRLNRVEGQIRGIRSMVEEERYCVDILTQVQACLLYTSYMQANPLEDGKQVTFTLERDGKPFELTVTPAKYQGNTLGMTAYSYRSKDAGALSIIKNSFSEVRYWMSYTFTSLKMLVTGKAGVDDLSGPVGIVNMVGQVVEESKSDGVLYVFLNLLNFSILLSVNLGVLNLLPLPALDGGRIVFILIEIIRGKPVSREKEGMVHTIGILLLLALMVFVMFNDVLKIMR